MQCAMYDLIDIFDVWYAARYVGLKKYSFLFGMRRAMYDLIDIFDVWYAVLYV